MEEQYVKCHFDLKVRPIEPDEDERWKLLMAEHHYLGTARFQGEQIKYVATLQGQWCALLIWAAAALKMAARDDWIDKLHYVRDVTFEEDYACIRSGAVLKQWRHFAI